MKNDENISPVKKAFSDFDINVRREWDEESEEFLFSVIDIIALLTESKRPRKYWSDLKARLNEEGSQLSEKIGQLKLASSDGKKYLTDVANVEQVFRIIQSIPSPKVEPLKLWLAKVGNDRIEESNDPEKAIDRAVMAYQRQGRSKEWINQRIKSIDVRKELTDEWKERGVLGKEFAILTDIITKTWSGKTVREYKKYKDLKKENLRDNMSNIELVMNMLAEASTTEISKRTKPKGTHQNRRVAKQGGSVAKVAREELEAKTGEDVVNPKNADDLVLEESDDGELLE